MALMMMAYHCVLVFEPDTVIVHTLSAHWLHAVPKKNKLAALSSRFSVQKTFMKNGSESRESDINTQT